MGQKSRTVWVVMHYEIMGMPDAPRVDSIQFHVSSSLAKAEAYVRDAKVDAHSWWQIHPHVIDTTDLDEGNETYFYSHRGARLKSAPTGRALIAFGRHVARYPEFYPVHPTKNE